MTSFDATLLNASPSAGSTSAALTVVLAGDASHLSMPVPPTGQHFPQVVTGHHSLSG